MPVAQSGLKEYAKLEQRLVLLAWLNNLLGYTGNRELLADAGSVAERYDTASRSCLYHHLLLRGKRLSIPAHDIASYDENIWTLAGFASSDCCMPCQCRPMCCRCPITAAPSHRASPSSIASARRPPWSRVGPGTRTTRTP